VTVALNACGTEMCTHRQLLTDWDSISHRSTWTPGVVVGASTMRVRTAFTPAAGKAHSGCVLLRMSYHDKERCLVVSDDDAHLGVLPAEATESPRQVGAFVMCIEYTGLAHCSRLW
jgi:hypothetical protein